MPQVRLLERAFEGCSRVIVTKLHGGFSGSLVLKTDSYGLDGSRDEPTVTKLDDAESMLKEVAKTAQFTKLVRASAAQVQRGPYLVNASGEPIKADASKEEDFGCVVLDMAGACWVMPEFFEELDTKLISTFKRHLVNQLAVIPGSENYVDAMNVMQELWGAGGPLRVLALTSHTRSDKLATESDGLIEGALRAIITSLMVAFRVPDDDAECKDLALKKKYLVPPSLDGCINKVLESRPNWREKVDTRRDRPKVFKNSLVHDCDAAVWRDKDTCKALVDLVKQLENLLLKPSHAGWLTGYKPLRMHQHGDLNCGNVLIDVRESLWLIDFATAGEDALFIDAAKMVSVILFEQFPVPLTLAELQIGGFEKLVDALGASEEQANDLISAGEACRWHSKAALLKEINGREAAKVKEREAAKQTLNVALSSSSKATEGATYATQELLLQSIEDDSVAEQRAKEAWAVIDLLLKPGLDGNQPQLWEMGERQPPADWPSYAQLALQLCARVMKVTTELVADCSRREPSLGASSDAVKEDLHAAHFLLPLLTRALCSVRYFQCGAWQKRVAWYAARRLAEALTPLLRQPPLPLPVPTDPVLTTKLRLVSGQPVAMLGADGRLSGGLGGRRLFLASAEDDSSAQHLISDAQRSLAFDQVDQTVLPWKAPGPEDVAALQDLVTIVSELVALRQTIPALEALRQTIPSLETLEYEHFQRAPGNAVSVLIWRLRQITTKCRALQEHVERQVREVFSDRSTTAAQLRGKLEHKFTLGSLEEKFRALQEHVERQMREVYSDSSIKVAQLRGKLEHKFTLGSLEEFVIDQLQRLGGLSVRSYAVGQRLLVHKDGMWLKQAVTRSAPGGAQHELEGTNGQFSIALHPWNHAPLVLPLADFEALRARHASTLQSQHASIVDALSGQRLNILEQCVPIKVVMMTEQLSSDLANVNEVAGLAKWLLEAHAARRDAADAGRKASLLLTAPPAAGKTCLMSQLVMHVLKSEECDMVPILIKVQELQRHLLAESTQPIFERSWNWVDAFLQCVHEAGSDLYSMLRQALMARRALVLLDGIDEGGKARDAIERHVTEVLAPQGHIILITSRPAGLNEGPFRDNFVHVELMPLSNAQQKQVINKRLGKDNAAGKRVLTDYVCKSELVPLDSDTQQRITGNPLMLSMIISIFQSKQKKDPEPKMPETVTELYKTASRVMLERVDFKTRGASAAPAGAGSPLSSLLEATFLQAHVKELRAFGEEELNRAASFLSALHKQEPELSFDVNQTLLDALDRVARDKLPLLSLLQAEPQRMQSSHLSFQEYFAMRAICTGKHRLPSGSPPWKWGPFWANVVKMGMEDRARFGVGLWRSAGVEGDELNLRNQLGGDRPTVLGVVCALLGSLRVLDLSENKLGPQGGAALAKGLQGNSTLESLKYRPLSARTSTSARLLLCQRPLTRLYHLSHPAHRLQYRGQCHRSRGHLRARCHPQGDNDLHPEVHRHPI